MALTIFKDPNTNLMLMQNSWSSTLNPVVNNPANQGLLLPNIAIKSGTNVINHRLGRTMQGWYLVDVDQAANLYRSAPLNALTLTLTSNADCTIALEVF